jgi:hypothetical protein
MARLLRRLGLRGGVAAGLLLVVVTAVVIAKLGGGDGPIRHPRVAPAVPTADPTAGDDGAVTTTANSHPDNADLLRAAATFTTAWLRRDLDPAAWHAGVARLTTASAGASLSGVDPRTVPATRTTGEPQLVLRTDRYALVAIPVDSGTLQLSLLQAEGGRWLVDGVDWERT